MKLQACEFSSKRYKPFEPGVAKVKNFGTYEVEWIVDSAGKKQKTVWTYRLIEGPLKYLEHE